MIAHIERRCIAGFSECVGPGFYTTTVLRQAHTWAAQIAARKTGAQAVVVELRVSRDDLATLDTLAFARSDFHADDFWSLVRYCKTGRRTTAAAADKVLRGPLITPPADPRR